MFLCGTRTNRSCQNFWLKKNRVNSLREKKLQKKLIFFVIFDQIATFHLLRLAFGGKLARTWGRVVRDARERSRRRAQCRGGRQRGQGRGWDIPKHRRSDLGDICEKSFFMTRTTFSMISWISMTKDFAWDPPQIANVHHPRLWVYGVTEDVS